MPASIKAKLKFSSILFQALILVPLISYWGFTTLIRPVSSYYRDYDPEIQYFMNSLAVFKGRAYYYLDHPGTPVEIMGSAILAAFYLLEGKNSQAFISSQLQNPEPFFAATHLFLTLSSSASAVLLYRTTLSTSLQGKNDHLLATAISLMYFGIHPLAFSTLTLWSHSSFNFPFGTMLLVLFWNFLGKKRDIRPLTLAMYALAAGLLTATMIYFATWVIGMMIFVYLRNHRNRIDNARTIQAMFSLGGYSFLGFAMAMLPAGGRMRYFLIWISNLIVHQGDYGSGELGIGTFQSLWADILDLINDLPALSFIMMAAFILTVYISLVNKKQQGSSETWAMTVALIIQATLLLLFHLKHPGSDSFFSKRYVLPVAATLPLLSLLVLQLLVPFSRLYRVSRALLIILVFAGFSYNLYDSIIKYDQKAEVIARSVEEASRAINEQARRKNVPPNELSVLWTYETFSRCYSLWFGNEYTGNVFSSEIREICGNQTALNIWNQGILADDEWVKCQDEQWDLVFTREHIYLSYPFLKELGNCSEYYQVRGDKDFDKYGDFVVISGP